MHKGECDLALSGLLVKVVKSRGADNKMSTRFVRVLKLGGAIGLRDRMLYYKSLKCKKP